MGNRSWWRAHYHDHPKLLAKSPEAYTNPISKEKPKLFCKRCWEAQLAQEQEKDEKDIIEGRRMVPQDISVIETDCKPYSLYLLHVLLSMGHISVGT